MASSISLTRQALLQIGTVSSHSSMLVIPPNNKNKVRKLQNPTNIM